jgi:hypothetical protein
VVRDATVLVIGLGDLGARVHDMLASSPLIDRLVGAGRDRERGAAIAAQGHLIANLTAGPQQVEFVSLDLFERDGSASVLRAIDPTVIVMAASRHTWWRTPARLAAIPYGAWLPVHLQLVRPMMEALAASGISGRVVCLPFPDAVGPALAPLGLAPHIGAGNVTEVAAKLAVLAAERSEVGPDVVEVRLIMHHAAERQAFGAFSGLAGSAEKESAPWKAEIRVRGRAVARDLVAEWFSFPYPLPPGTATHQLTAAATVHLIHALLSDQPRRTHAPAPSGLPGGYPVVLSRSGISLDLPQEMTVHAAVDLNDRAGRSDGIERIEPDGTVIFTTAVARATEQILGMRLQRVIPGDQSEVAEELLRRAAVVEGQHPITAG